MSTHDALIARTESVLLANRLEMCKLVVRANRSRELAARARELSERLKT